VSVKCTIYE